jgi:hypothetical protein
MNALRILFSTDRFNLSKVGAHFINPCCFGEDLAAWLRNKLIERQVETREPHQKDWGWELPVKEGDQSYYLCISGNADGSTANPNDGEWGIIVERKRSISQRITGAGKIAKDDRMVRLLNEILNGEAAFRDVHFEDSGA